MFKDDNGNPRDFRVGDYVRWDTSVEYRGNGRIVWIRNCEFEQFPNETMVHIIMDGETHRTECRKNQLTAIE